MSTTLRFAELPAPPDWTTIDFVSDLHLQAADADTLAAWERYMAHTRADAVFILGDLFEVWIGDDAPHAGAPDDEEARCERHAEQVLQAASARCAIHVMHGNRDFLLGRDFAQRCGLRLLDDPTVLAFAGQRWLLTHGDALCLDDTEYQRFRAQVRSAAWRETFLAQALAQRRTVARSLREESERRKHSGASYADIDAALARDWLAAAHAPVLIHGHTHRPGDHVLGPGLQRHVLSDWDLRADPPRAQVLRLRRAQPNGPADVQRLPAAAAA